MPQRGYATATKPPATKPENPTAEIDLTGSASLCRDNLRNVMELSEMQMKRQETTAELTDKFQCVHNRHILCTTILNH